MSGEKTDDGAKVAIVLDIPEESYEVGTAEIPYIIRNESGQPADIVMAPMLERKNGEDWEAVDCTGGFCGTPDPIEESHEGILELTDWYPDAGAGVYRLSFSGKDGNGTKLVLSDTFEIV